MTNSGNTSKQKRFPKFSDKFYNFSGWVILTLCLLIFVFLSVQSLISTTLVYNLEDDPSTVIFLHDNFYINLAFITIVFICGMLFLRKIMTRINPKIFAGGLILYVIILGVIWNVLTQSSPAHDSYFVISAAEGFASNDFSALIKENSDYFYSYPFQLGYVLACEIIFRIFKDNSYFVIQLINVLSVAAIFSALLFITKLAFSNRRITNFTTFFLFGCIQPILFSTFHYGNLPGFAFSMWAVVFTCYFIKTHKIYNIVLTALFIGIGAMLKANSLIILVAICILLIIDFVKNHSLRNLICLGCAILFGASFNSLAIFQYEKRADIDLGDGIPQILWLDMGLQETSNPNRPGWYNPEYTYLKYIYNDMNGEKASQSGRDDISIRVRQLLSSSSSRADFFTIKTNSQWNDPLYMSIWVCSTRPSRHEIGSFVQSMYDGTAGNITENYANFYQSLIFVFAVAGVGFIIFKRKMRQNIYCLVLPLVFLGGFLYHLLFEAMPQYNVTYFTLFVPLAAAGFSALCDKYNESFTNFLKKHFGKKETVKAIENIPSETVKVD